MDELAWAAVPLLRLVLFAGQSVLHLCKRYGKVFFGRTRHTVSVTIYSFGGYSSMTTQQNPSIAQLFDLTGKVAIVTGGAMGIGQGIALRLAEAGAAVMITDINPEAANNTVDQIRLKGGKAEAINADASSVADARRTVQETVRAFGRLDIIVNNAGIYPFAPALADDRGKLGQGIGYQSQGPLLLLPGSRSGDDERRSWWEDHQHCLNRCSPSDW